MVNERGVSHSYQLSPRARLFRKYANTIQNISDAKLLMRYNNYLNDPLEMSDPVWAIMSRFDYDRINGPQNEIRHPYGGTDTKLANFNMIQNLMCIAQSGPTHDNLPPYSFDTIEGKVMYMYRDFLTNK